MRIMTANIAMGLGDMDRLSNNLKGLAAYHSWFALLGVAIPAFRGKYAGASYSKYRVDYLTTHKNLEPLFQMIEAESPDILILNEVVLPLHGEEVESRLKGLGFKAISYGRGGKYPNAYITTYVAAKVDGKPLLVEMPQPPMPACGGGVAGLRLTNGISVIGAHTAFGGSDLWRGQIKSFAEVAEEERRLGNQVILAGDWNEVLDVIEKQPDIQRLGFQPVDPQKTVTCPVSVPRLFRRQLDHIFVPKAWNVESFRTQAFKSDHLAIVSDVSSTGE